MKKAILVFNLVPLFIFWVLGSVIVFGQTPGALNPCALFTKGEAEALFKEAVSEGEKGKTMMPAGVSCKYSYQKKGAYYSLTIKVATAETLKPEGLFDSPKDYFLRQKKARLASEQTAKKFKMLSGLGEEAFWSGYDLLILRGPYFINIAVHSYLGGTFKNKEAMEKARIDQDLALAQKVAEKVLPRIR